jgi:hypothetical protein
LLVVDERCRKGATRQPNRELITEPEDAIIPTTGGLLERQPGEVRVLILE